jgi:TonB-linked SusC/RagA family outer membrane protein
MKQVYLFKYGLTLLLFIFAMAAFAQSNSFSGKVLDENSQPLPGATVRIKGTDQSTSTDLKGKFSFPKSNQSAIVVTVTFVGYDEQEKIIQANEAVTVQLVPNQKSLSEVVVVGYGTVKKTDLTGAVTNLTAKDLDPGAVTNPLQQIVGKAAGVEITQVGSEPGVAPTIRIRGITSLEGGNDPLVVVDGIQGDMSLLNQVPPSEIASIDVLKDASATAIYGSRGAPGVVIVTTKKSAAGKTTVEYTENTSLDVISRPLKELTAAEWNQEATALGTDPSAFRGSNTDWFDLITRDGVTQNHTLAFGGGANEFNYRASVTAIDQTGVVINTSYRKYIARIIATQKALDDKLTLTMNVNNGINDATYEPNGIGNADYSSDLISQAYVTKPVDPVYNTDGTYYTDPDVFGFINPYAVSQTVKNNVNDDYLFGSLRADLDIYKGLTASWFGSWRKDDNNDGYYLPPESQVETAVENNGIANISNNITDERLMDIDLSYKHDWGKSHFDALALYEWQGTTYNGNFTQMRDFPDELTGYNALQLGNIADFQPGDITSYKNARALVSYLGRANYSWDNKYLLTASFRRDGSTVFGVNNKWGNFPSAALAWRIDQEDFMKSQQTVSELKLRVGYGITGNQQGISPNNSIALVGLSSSNPVVSFGGADIPNYAATQNANPNLKWETIKQGNAGLDFGFFNDKLTGTVDVYTANTDNLLFNYTVPIEGPFLFNSILANLGSLQRQGAELSLSYTVIKSKDVTLTLAGNGSLMRNKVLSLGGDIDGYDIPTNYVSLGGGGNAYLVVGKPIGTYLILHHTGVDANGGETVYGETGDNTASVDVTPQSKDRFDEGQVLPTYAYAFTPSFTYKNFDASMVWTGQGGNKIYDGLEENLSLLENIGKSNLLQSAIPLGIHSTSFSSDEWLQSGAFLRFENLSFGYKFNVTGWKYISALRVSLIGQNLAIITKYKGLDPEIDVSGDNGSGSDYGTYPRTRTYSAGLDVIFK